MTRIGAMLVGVLLVTATSVSAQTVTVPYPVPSTYKIGWDHEAPALVDRFESRLGAAAWTDVGKTACPSPNTSSFCQPFPIITSPGTYTFEVRACNLAGCSSAAPLSFTAVASPGQPTGLRVIKP